jgi:hypothetical protein
VAAFEWLVKLPKKEREMDLSGVRDAAMMLTTAFCARHQPGLPQSSGRMHRHGSETRCGGGAACAHR